MAARTFAAVDIGASGGRLMAGTVSRDGIQLDAVHRFPNGPVEVDGHLRWDFEHIVQQVAAGLRMIDAESVGIDTWAVDYGLLDASGELLAPPISYRDERTSSVIDEVHHLIPPAELYRLNGLQFLPFNTIYQLAAERRGPLWSSAAHVALIPDLLAHRLTGVLRTELTNASTTGLLDPRTHQWSPSILDRLGLPAQMLTQVEPPGVVRGETDAGAAVTTVASHDTASAVAAVPAVTEHFAYIASGTWSLVGVELDRPLLTAAARQGNFTNELGVDGRIRFLRNVGGLWLLQECMREWDCHDLDTLLAAAGETARGPLIDVDDRSFIAPGSMPERICAAARRELKKVEIVRCILDSLAVAYAGTIDHLASTTGTRIDVVHIVGGGAQNELLCRLTADATGRPVIAGPVEATALGNVLVQARAHGAAPRSLEELRAVVAGSFDLRRYEPT
ncbi:rhamnulokinase [Dermatobacter hominis]|uniref:rhamnulokinase n=1 Tax=Dermatobacter hominis TaxID=2884263 RepID=UPI001D0FCF36|nr:rhamnulokinase family protein [Dermatobacter hominis]UDY34915.1 rhamnulokinase [Dermatobacter hominis]